MQNGDYAIARFFFIYKYQRKCCEGNVILTHAHAYRFFKEGVKS